MALELPDDSEEIIALSDMINTSEDETVHKCFRSLASESIKIHKEAITSLKLLAEFQHDGENESI